MLNKKIMVLAMILVSLLAVSAVSAAENVTDDVVSAENANDDYLAVSDDADVIADDGSVYIDVYYDPDLDDSRDYFADIYAPKDASGNVTVTCDGVVVFNNEISRCRYDGEDEDTIFYLIGPADLDIALDSGYHHISASYTGDDYYSSSSTGYIYFYGADDESGDNVSVTLYDEIYLDRNGVWEDYLVRIESPVYATGNVTVLINGKKAFERKVATMYIHPSDLNVTLQCGAAYYVEVKYSGDEEYGNVIKSGELKTTYQLDAYVSSMKYGGPGTLTVILPENADGVLTVTVGGKTYPISYTGRQAELDVITMDLVIGYQSLTVNYKNDSSYPDNHCDVNFTVRPNVIRYNVISSDEEPIVMVWVSEGSSDSARFYDNDGMNVTVPFVGGVAYLKLPKFSTGSKFLGVEVICDGQPYYDYGYFMIKNSNSEFTSNISASEINVTDNVTVTITGQDAISEASIFIDGIEHTVNSTTNVIRQDITGLADGQHLIGVRIYKDNSYHTNSFLVTVKDPNKPVTNNTSPGSGEVNGTSPDEGSGKNNVTVPDDNKGTESTGDVSAPKSDPAVGDEVVKLTLKTVKVKKSAKKLVVQATLKINGKPVKGKVVKFKFNGKTYKAKTNVKGIAKVTIKSKVLKKLKVGKKVKYQAVYGKTTVKKIVKVKK